LEEFSRKGIGVVYMKCSYCSKEIEKGRGIMFVHRSGKISYYCSNRCYKFDTVYHRKFKKQQK